LRKGLPLAAVASLLAFIAWHPLQAWLNLPFGRPEFLDARFLSLVAWLGLASTHTRLRSGSIWPAVIIHWGAVVVWLALYADGGA
jgi:predicted Abi (CAAX) family protease